MQPRSQVIDVLKTAIPPPGSPSSASSGHLAAVEEDLAHRRGAQAHLRERLPDRETGRVPSSTRNAVMPAKPSARSIVANTTIEIGLRRVRDERLRPVQHVAGVGLRRASSRARTRRTRSPARSSRAQRSGSRRRARAGSAASAPRCRTATIGVSHAHICAFSEKISPLSVHAVAERLERDDDRQRVRAGAAELVRHRQRRAARAPRTWPTPRARTSLPCRARGRRR